MAKKFINKITDGAHNLYEKAKQKISDISQERANSKELTALFEQKATQFQVFDPSTKKVHFIKAIKDANKKAMLVRQTDKLQCNFSLKADQQEYIVTDIDKTEELFTHESVPDFAISCYIIHYVYSYEINKNTPIINTSTHYHQTVNNTGIMGEVNQQIINIDNELASLDKIIDNTKASLLHKSKKQNIEIMIGQFKDCVRNKQKDETLFSKLKKAVKDFAPAALVIIEKIISTVFS